MANLTILTPDSKASNVLPALALMPFRLRVMPLQATSIVKIPSGTIVFVDGTRDLDFASSICQIIADTAPDLPTILVVTEEGMKNVTMSNAANDVVIAHASSAEVETRIRLAQRTQHRLEIFDDFDTSPNGEGIVNIGELTLNTKAYKATIRGVNLDLAYKEFEVLKFLILNAGRVCTRSQLLLEVWGYDYYGGTRTVDVHIRRLRSKLGVEYEQLINTVRNVGYRFEVPHGL